jgi:uncharacterized coiled-coil protein SlyX
MSPFGSEDTEPLEPRLDALEAKIQQLEDTLHGLVDQVQTFEQRVENLDPSYKKRTR